MILTRQHSIVDHVRAFFADLVARRQPARSVAAAEPPKGFPAAEGGALPQASPVVIRFAGPVLIEAELFAVRTRRGIHLNPASMEADALRRVHAEGGRRPHVPLGRRLRERCEAKRAAGQMRCTCGGH